MRYTSNYLAHPRMDWGGALSGVSTGYQMGSSIGSIFGPIGSKIAGGVGAVIGGLTGNAAENRRFRQQAKLDAQLAMDKAKAKAEEERMYKKQLLANDKNYLANFDLNDTNSLFMADGGKIAVSGTRIGNGNKLLTKNGSTTGTHETGSNIPIKKKGRVVAYAEPGEVLVNDKDMPNTPFILSKRIGRRNISFADEFMQLEDMKTAGNYRQIENEQANLITMNNRLSKKGKFAANGMSFNQDGTPMYLDPLTQSYTGTKGSKYMRTALGQVFHPLNTYQMTPQYEISIGRKYGNGIGINSSTNVTPTSIVKSKGNELISNNLIDNSIKYNAPEAIIDIPTYTKSTGKTMTFNNPAIESKTYAQAEYNKLNKVSGLKKIGNTLGKVDMNTLMGGIGTVGNLLMTNKTLKRQRGLIDSSLKETLAYNPRLNKNYLLNDVIDVNDQTSAVNQGFASSVSGLEGVDSTTSSALRNSANITRLNALNQIYGDAGRQRIGIRNQNVANIMSNNTNNTNLLNETALMKLNAKIAANEQLGDLESARLGNVQGAVSDFNTILRDRDIMKSLRARWKDTIGNDAFGTNEMRFGGRIGKRMLIS